MSEELPAHGFLLDTHTAIWALESPERLTATARKAVQAGPNVLSVLSYWEVMLKSRKGTLDVGDLRLWWSEALDQLAAVPLLLRPRHIAAVYNLPPHHKDPFDRLLIAQASAEKLALVTMNGQMARYASKDLRIVGGGKS